VTDLGVVGVGECLGLGAYDENLVLWYLLLTIHYLLFVRYILHSAGAWPSRRIPDRSVGCAQIAIAIRSKS
jgi:hypothetical protein